MDDQPATVEPGERRPARRLERPPSERFAATDAPPTPADATPAGAPPPVARAIVAAFLAAIGGGVALAVAGGILTITAGLLVVAVVVGWVVAVVFTRGARLVHRSRMTRCLAASSRVENRAVLAQVVGIVGRKAAGHDQRRAAAAFGIEGGESPHAVGPRFELGMHRAHHDSVGQGEKAQLERAKEVGVG